jgi:hypothetical protein
MTRLPKFLGWEPAEGSSDGTNQGLGTPSFPTHPEQTPVLDPSEARALLDRIDTASVLGLRDRALIGHMVYSFAQIGAALWDDGRGCLTQNRRLWMRLREACYRDLGELETRVGIAEAAEKLRTAPPNYIQRHGDPQ